VRHEQWTYSLCYPQYGLLTKNINRMKARTGAWRLKNKELNEAIRALEIKITQAPLGPEGINSLKLALEQEEPISPEASTLRVDIKFKEYDLETAKGHLERLKAEKQAHAELLNSPTESPEAKRVRLFNEMAELEAQKRELRDQLKGLTKQINNKVRQINRLDKED